LDQIANQTHNVDLFAVLTQNALILIHAYRAES